MGLATTIGLVAATLTTFAFVPQVVKVWRHRSTQDISLWMYLAFCFGVLSWLIYGIMIAELPVILANAVTLILAAIVLGFKIRYG